MEIKPTVCWPGEVRGIQDGLDTPDLRAVRTFKPVICRHVYVKWTNACKLEPRREGNKPQSQRIWRAHLWWFLQMVSRKNRLTHANSNVKLPPALNRSLWFCASCHALIIPKVRHAARKHKQTRKRARRSSTVFNAPGYARRPGDSGREV